jgi:hypothetical protein
MTTEIDPILGKNEVRLNISVLLSGEIPGHPSKNSYARSDFHE